MHRLRFANSYTRMGALLDLADALGSRGRDMRRLWYELGREWPSCDNISAYTDELFDILECAGTIAAAMTPTERKHLAALPESVRVYRGCYAHNRCGWSWSLSEAVASRFPTLNRYRHDGMQALLLVGELDRRDVLFLKLDCDEEEIVTVPDRVAIHEVRELGDIR